MRVIGWIATVVAAGVVLGAIVAGAAGSSQDVKRYVRMRKM
jgi:hypothetical protein